MSQSKHLSPDKQLELFKLYKQLCLKIEKYDKAKRARKIQYSLIGDNAEEGTKKATNKDRRANLRAKLDVMIAEGYVCKYFVAEALDAYNTLVSTNMNLVYKIASQRQSKTMSFDDLVSAGTCGLMDSLEIFDPTKGCKVSSHMVFWVYYRIQEAFRKNNLIVMPQKAKNTFRFISEISDEGTSIFDAIKADTRISVVDQIHRVVTREEGELLDRAFGTDFTGVPKAETELEKMLYGINDESINKVVKEIKQRIEDLAEW